MAPYYNSSCLLLAFAFMFFLFLLPNSCVDSISFGFDSFKPNTLGITFEGDAFASNNVIQLTKNQLDAPIKNSVGRASYAAPINLWNATTGSLASFSTRFTFVVDGLDQAFRGDGFAFFIAPYESTIPNNSYGGFLGLFNDSSSTNENVVAVEFDTFANSWDPTNFQSHVGIDIDSIKSKTAAGLQNSVNETIGDAYVSYSTYYKTLSAFVRYVDINNGIVRNASVWYDIDLRNVLPGCVRVGFSAATGDFVELHTISSWYFSSSL